MTLDCVDSGPGVHPDDRERIFTPFFRGRRQAASIRADWRGGSGVGLSIVRELVEAHGGAVRLLRARRGAHFRIELPPPPGAASPAQSPQSARFAQSARPEAD